MDSCSRCGEDGDGGGKGRAGRSAATCRANDWNGLAAGLPITAQGLQATVNKQSILDGAPRWDAIGCDAGRA